MLPKGGAGQQDRTKLLREGPSKVRRLPPLPLHVAKQVNMSRVIACNHARLTENELFLAQMHFNLSEIFKMRDSYGEESNVRF